MFARIDAALAALRAGRPVLVLDDAERENEGDVVLAAETLTTPWLAWTIRHTSGYLCAPLPSTSADRLGLPLMVDDNEDRLQTAYTITVDAARGVTTGISAADRAHTLRTLAAPTSEPGDLVRPGHIVPLRARAGGVFARRGHTEAAVDLCRLAGLAPVGAIAELVADDGEMLRTPAVLALGRARDLPVITIADLVAWRRRHERVRRLTPACRGTRDRELTMATHANLRMKQGKEPSMAGHGAPEYAADGSGLRIAVIAANWHAEVIDGLLGGARRALADADVATVTEVRVPGSFELPVAAARLAPGHDAVVALGVVIRGGTPHFDYVCSAATTGLTEVSVRTGVPVGFGVLTCDTDAQARDRAGLPGSSEDKGYEAAMAAVATAVTLAGSAATLRR